MHNIQKNQTFDPFLFGETIDECLLDGTQAAAPSTSGVATFHTLFKPLTSKHVCFFFFFRGVCSPEHLLKCCLMHRKSPALIISARIPLMTCSALLWSFLLSVPLIRLRPFSCFISHRPFFFFFLRTNSPTNSSPFSVFLVSSVGRLLIEFSSQMSMERVQKENPNVTEGGRYAPPDCRPRWKVGIYESILGVL